MGWSIMGLFKRILFAVFAAIAASAIIAPASPAPAFAESNADREEYRNLTLATLPDGAFRIPMPEGPAMNFTYHLEFGEPYRHPPFNGEPYVMEFPDLTGDRTKFWRGFFDKVFLKDGSYIQFNDEKVPLTCIFVDGQDNRNADPGGNFPRRQFIMKIYLVANDYQCMGPKRNDYRGGGRLRDEAWETYVYYEVHDPTIMLPMEAHLRIRWNELAAVWVKK
jgi:hypothetical protein